VDRDGAGLPDARKLAQLNTTSTAELHARMLVRADPAPMRCLTVDSPNSMFLVTPWCIPTHNTMFGAPSGWTPVSKTCPGTIHIRQFNQTVLPAIVAGSTGGGLSVADANSLERHLDVIKRKVETTFDQVNSNDAALSSELDGISAQVSQLQADMDRVKQALGIAEA
jgi:hypothetical protein